MKILDISWPISETMTGYKNKKEFKKETVKILPQDSSEESIFTIGSHAGTHIDAPAHMLYGGKHTGSISLDSLIGEALVLDMTYISQAITVQDLERYFSSNLLTLENKIVLFKTKNSFLEPDALFDPSFIYITHDAAQYLVDKKVKAVGIDYLGIERNQPDHETHALFMHANIIIIEGLRLKEAVSKSYVCICLPLAIDADASPARAILLDKSIF